MINKIVINANVADPTLAVKNALNSIKENEETLIEFEKGTYNFTAESAEIIKTFSSGGTSSYHNIPVIFPIIDKKNITIDGCGSEFVYCDRVQPFYIYSSENVTIKNFSSDFSFLRYAYADVYKVCEEGFGVSFDENIFSYSVKDGYIYFNCGSTALSTGERKISSKRYYPHKGGTFFLYVGDFGGEYNLAAPNVMLDAEKTDCGVFLRYREGSPKTDFREGDKVCLAYDNDREMQFMHCEFTKTITLDNVTIYRQGGMGFVADVCDNITLNNFNIMLKDGRDEIYSTTADGIFLTNCKGEFNVIGCNIKNCYDDAMNVHGYYTKIKNVLDNGYVELSFIHPHHTGLLPYFAGDKVTFTDPNGFNYIGESTIEEVYYSEDRSYIKLKFSSTEGLKPEIMIENRSRMPKVTVENSTFINCPHIRLSAPEMVVKGNKFGLNAADLYIYDLIDFWAECGAVHDLTITDNEFLANCKNNIVIGSCRPAESNWLHKRIVVKNNRFARSQSDTIVASGVNELIVEDNQYGCEIK